MMPMKISIILVNLLVGNAILYFYHLTEFITYFSLSAMLVLSLALQMIRKRSFFLKAVTLSLAVTFLIPALGFWFSMFFHAFNEISLEITAEIFTFTYILWAGALAFCWDKFLIMFILNLILFLWFKGTFSGSKHTVTV